MLLKETNLIDQTKDRIKKHEGYSNTVYKDTRGFRTIGYGHLCHEDEGWIDDKVYKKEILEKQFDVDFKTACDHAEKIYLQGNVTMNPKALSILTEMVFQLGYNGVKKFKKMLSAIYEEQFDIAADEMLDSLWNKQTPKRSKNLSDLMRKIEKQKIVTPVEDNI